MLFSLRIILDTKRGYAKERISQSTLGYVIAVFFGVDRHSTDKYVRNVLVDLATVAGLPRSLLPIPAEGSSITRGDAVLCRGGVEILLAQGVKNIEDASIGRFLFMEASKVRLEDVWTIKDIEVIQQVFINEKKDMTDTMTVYNIDSGAKQETLCISTRGN